ncbi:MAG: UDP-N-acetylmuramoyl-tripeptide--D-alanyl-D-alanine ligase [Balneolaceae bacterium]
MGYKNNEYRQWLKSHWDAKVIPWELGLFNIFIFITILPDDWFPFTLTRSAVAIVLFMYGFFWLSSVRRYKEDKVKKPLVLTSRVKRLIAPLVLFTAIMPVFFTYSAYTGNLLFSDMRLVNYNPGLLGFDVTLLVFGWVFGAILLPFWVLLSGWVMGPIELNIQEGFKKQARKKLASMPHLKVIAITGSYGKTSTKFMVRDLLKERFSVCSTPGSYNTPMGICKVINNDLQSHHQILILEMGARYEGNILELCDIAQPNIAIVTNVGVAHLETFGSKDIIAKEKGTVVENLPAGGVAILNADDELVASMGANRTDIERITTGLTSGDIKGGKISYTTSGSKFTVQIGEQSEDIQTRLLGAHNVQNMLLAIGVAHHLEVRLKTMAVAAKKIEPIEHRLELKKAGDLFIIDDAFNSNPVGAKNAVEILGSFNTGKRIIITPGMVELGELEYEENKNFGEAIGKANLDIIILVGEERAKPILEGVRLVGNQAEKVKIVPSLFEANELVRRLASAGDVVLYENDLPDVYNE